MSDEDQYFYDEHGRYKGRRTKEGYFYDEHSNYLGREDEHGNFYDRFSNYRGRRYRQRGMGMNPYKIIMTKLFFGKPIDSHINAGICPVVVSICYENGAKKGWIHCRNSTGMHQFYASDVDISKDLLGPYNDDFDEFGIQTFEGITLNDISLDRMDRA